jgi:hypothetical protein
VADKATELCSIFWFWVHHLFPPSSFPYLTFFYSDLHHHMMRSQRTRLLSLLVSLLLLADLSSVSFGWRVAELDAGELGDSGASPPAKGRWFTKQASSSASGRHLGDGYRHMRVESKRLVAQGPNPLHN